MAYVGPDANLRDPTVSPDAVYAKFAGTPLQGYEPVFLALADTYQIDPNWALSYLQWESGFGASQVGLANPTNPWDILSVPGQWGQIDTICFRLCYAVYPDVPTGLEAGFRLWSYYADLGYGDWFESLSRALCGNAAGCGGDWVANVIATGQQNAVQWPYVGGPPPPPPPPPLGCEPNCIVILPPTDGSILDPVAMIVAELFIGAVVAAPWWVPRLGIGGKR